MGDRDDVLDRAIGLLREPVLLDPALDGRIMQAVAGLPTPARPGPLRRAGVWLVHPRPIRVRPVLALAAAAAVVLAVVAVRGGPSSPAVAPVAGTAEATPVRFVLVAPQATSVSVVGDFNDWTTGTTPMRSTVSEGLWTVTVPLRPGRYRYAFLVDGSTWVPDPGAPKALDDDFGRPNSVVTIGGS